MNISLLYKNQIEVEASPHHERLIEKLSIDLILDQMFFEEKEYVLGLMTKPLKEKEEIEFRQEIIKYFIKNPTMLKEMSYTLNAFVETVEGIGEERKRLSKLNTLHAMTEPYICGKGGIAEKIIDEANYGLQIFNYIERLNLVFSKYQSDLPEGLERLNQYIQAKYYNKEYKALKTLLHNLSNDLPTVFSAQLMLEYDYLLRIEQVDLAMVKKDEVQKESYIKYLLNKKSRTDEFAPIQLNKIFENEIINCSRIAVENNCKIIKGMTDQLIDILNTLHQELSFYRLALRLMEVAEKVEVPCILPTFLPKTSNTIHFDTLYDPNLVMRKLHRYYLPVIPNNMSYKKEQKGMVIIGDNSTGKTVYLRSVATSYLWGLCGLPVFAEEATLSLRNHFYVQFASSEKEVEKNTDAAGRFENEVKEMAEILNDLEENSIIFLNETFQTTYQEEAVDVLSNIFEVLHHKKVQYILVTHLREVIERLRPEEDFAFLQLQNQENRFLVKAL